MGTDATSRTAGADRRAGIVHADVLIAGGGPAGCAAALSLRAHAPGRSVVVVEPGGGARVGESLPPAARRALGHLGLWPAFLRQGHRESHGTAAVWGADAYATHDAVFSTGGTGYHLDRARFDALLADGAREAGARWCETRVRGAERSGGGWRVALADGTEAYVRVLIDATGRAATLARRLGGVPRQTDRLVAFARFASCAGGDPRTTVEAVEDGWWYTSGLPDRRRIVVFLTDADLAAPLGAGRPEGWEAALGRTVRVSGLAGCLDGPVSVWPTESRALAPAAGEGWLAVGDAAAVVDPLSSQGILRALQGGVFAAYAAADALDGRPDALARYARYQAGTFASFADLQAEFYRRERRWPAAPFWARRHAAAPAPPERTAEADGRLADDGRSLLHSALHHPSPPTLVRPA